MAEDVARAAALRHLRAAEVEPVTLGAGDLVWDAAGRAMWRFRLPLPAPAAPEFVLDVDATDGSVTERVPPR